MSIYKLKSTTIRNIHVVDGDTLDAEARFGPWIFPVWIKTRGRWSMINTPEIAHKNGEKSQPYGEAAKAYVKRLLEGKRAAVVYGTKDGQVISGAYGRPLWTVYLGMMCVNEDIVKRGLAQIYDNPTKGSYNPKVFERIKQAQEYAKKKKLGIWKKRKDGHNINKRKVWIRILEALLVALLLYILIVSC